MAEECALCQLWERSAQMRRPERFDARAWERWDGSAHAEADIAALAAEFGVVVAPERVRQHFRRHRPVHPPPARSVRREEARAEVNALPVAERRVLDSVFRSRIMSARQLTRLHPDLGAAQLAGLTRRHLLYRAYPPTRLDGGRGAPEALYLPGRRLVPWMQAHYGPQVPDDLAITHAEQVRPLGLRHDTGVSEMFLRLWEDAQGITALPDGTRARLALNPANWWASRHLVLGYFDRGRQERRSVVPDGLCALSVRTDAPGRWPRRALWPLWYEYDRGTKTYEELVDQLLAYHFLALSGAPGERFPDLHVPGYRIPVLFAITGATRLRTARERLLALCAQRGLTPGSPIMLCDAEAFFAAPYQVPVFYAWDQQPERSFPLLALVERISAPLESEGRLHEESVLRLDRSAARRLPGSGRGAGR